MSENDNASVDTQQVRYCESHEASWITTNGVTEKRSSCPWCQRDKFWDELELIHEIFSQAISTSESKGGQQVPYHGDFGHVNPSTLRSMRWYVRRWDELLGKNIRRGS